MKPTLAYYIASHVPQEANEVLMDHGYSPARNTAELEYRLKEFINDQKEEALTALAAIHPDREILSPGRPDNKSRQHSNCCGNSNFSGDDGFSNCSGGCSCNSSKKHSNASGEASTGGQSAQHMISGNMTMAIVALVIIGVIGMTLIKK